MRKIPYLLVLLLFAGVSFGQEKNLSLKGDGVKVVKVDKVVIVKEDATVVQSFPFTITAPEGSILYFWTYPASLQADDLGGSLEVTGGTKGVTKVSVKAINVELNPDKTFKTLSSKVYSISFSIGDVPTPPGPDPKPIPPIPTPDDVITAAVLGAYQQEFDPAKKDQATKLAQAWKAAADKVDSAVTYGDISGAMKNKAKELGVNGKLPTVAGAISAQLTSAGFPISPSVLVAPVDKGTLKSTLTKVYNALSSVP